MTEPGPRDCRRGDAEPRRRRRASCSSGAGLRNKNIVIGAALFALLLAAAVLAGRPRHPRAHPARSREPPGAAGRRNFLGTDEFGRDVYSLVADGARVSLLVGGVTMLFTSLGGTLVGLVAGYYRRLDLVVMRFMDGLMAFPAILLAIALMAARGPGVWNVIIALSLVTCRGRRCSSAARC